MNNPRNIAIEEYNYNLPESRIAKFPMAKRDESKLLIYNHGTISHDVFKNIANYLHQGELLVYNNTKVIQARLHFRKTTGATIEVFLLEPYSPCDYEQVFQTKQRCAWVCMIGNLKKWRSAVVTNGTNSTALHRAITVGDNEIVLSVTLGPEEHTGHIVYFEWDNDTVTFAEILEAVGELPIPPYLNRKTEESDKETYQTVYSRIKGSVAAPTAGLHFTDEVLKDIDKHGIIREEVTLHVGAGTFKPVKSKLIEGHEMHQEYISVKRSAIENIINHGGKAIAVGTTSVRTLESLYYIGCRLYRNPDAEEEQLCIDQWEPYDTPCDIPTVQALQCIVDWMTRNSLTTLHSATRIIIAPGYKYHVVKMLITNFHQPQSTLLLLVSALIGDDWHKVYDYALKNDFRFLSYGDSSLLIP